MLLSVEGQFSLYSPGVDIVKGGGKSSNKEMIVSGVASTLDRDCDDEILDPNGFVLDYFLQTGFINWHHATKDSPTTIIGEPLEAFTKDNKFFVKARLYDFQPLAHEVYNIASALSKNKTKRKLGWSIEGKKIAIHPLDKNFITKSKITGLAITPMPKNGSTYLDIVKGLKFDITKEILSDGIEREIVLDIVKGGKRILVDKGLNIIVEKEQNEFNKNIVILKNAIEMGMIDKRAIHFIKERASKGLENF